jgi:2-oxo-4-hydroxy-4-carboxy--5-ureidoimidazoline (OHCU) decarboxylase
MDSSLSQDRDVELQRAIDAVVDIARARLEVLGAGR